MLSGVGVQQGAPPGNAAAAGRIVNAIPELCRAPAGLVSGPELPLIVGRGLLR